MAVQQQLVIIDAMRYVAWIAWWALALCSTAYAQEKKWLPQIQLGDSIQLVTIDSFWYKGKLMQQTDSTLTISSFQQSSRTDVVTLKEVARIKLNTGAWVYNPLINEPEIAVSSSGELKLEKTIEPGVAPVYTVYDPSISEAEKMADQLGANKRELEDANTYAPSYFITENAIGMEKGNVYYKSFCFLYHNVSYAIDDHFSVGGGIELVSALLQQPFGHLQAKAQTRINKHIHVSVNWIYGGVYSIANANMPFDIQLITGTVTLGNKRNNVSFGTGFNSLKKGEPHYTFAGALALSDYVAVVTDNTLFYANETQQATSLALGLRWSGNKNVALDFFLMASNAFDNQFYGIPVLAVHLKL